MNLFFKRVKIKQKSLILAWGLYDLANQFFALNIVSFYFALWVIVEKQTPEIFYSISIGLSLLAVALLAPFLGAISDLMHRRRIFLVFFTLVSVLFTLSLGLTETVAWALVFFAVANFGCQTAIIFYNALLINIAPGDKIGLVSGIGKMLGYCGAVLGLYIIHPLVEASGSRQAAFIPTGLLFFLFALPCMLFIKDKQSNQRQDTASFLKQDGFSTFIKSFIKNIFVLLKFSRLANFLKSAFFCLSVVNILIVFMTVYVTRVFGLNEGQVRDLFIFSTIFAIVGSLLSGYISDYIGYKRSIIIIFFLWAVCLLIAALAKNILACWFIGPLVGIALGSTWVVFRAFVVQIAPADKIAEIFGLFTLIGYIAGIVGVLFWGGILWFLRPLGELGYRFALLSLTLLLLPGFYYLRRI